MELEAKPNLNDLDKKKLNHYQEKLKIVVLDKESLMNICLSTLVISLFGAFLGFLAWRKNLQVHLDLKIKYETELLKFQVDTANKQINKD